MKASNPMLCAGVLALFLSGCSTQQLFDVASDVQENTISAANLKAGIRFQDRVNAEKRVNDYVLEAAASIAAGNQEDARNAMIAAQLVACHYDTRLPIYWLELYATIGSMDGELDGAVVDPPWPPTVRAWECGFPEELEPEPSSNPE